MSDQSGREPALPSGMLKKISGNEPMISKFNLTRMGKTQQAFMKWLNSNPMTYRDGRCEVPFLEVWKWMHGWTGNENFPESWRSEANHWTSAAMARLLGSLHKRGLIVVFQDEHGRNHVRSRVPAMKFDQPKEG